MSKEEVKEQITMWYAGPRLMKGGKLAHFWTTNNEASTDTDNTGVRVYDKLKGHVIGGEYECTQVVGTTRVDTTPAFTGRRSAHSAVWTIDARADAAIHRARAMEKKAMSDNTPVGELTIADASVWIHKVFGEHRRARIAVILDALGV